MSLSKKTAPLSKQLKEKRDLSKISKVKRKSSSSKDIPTKAFDVKDEILTKNNRRNLASPLSINNSKQDQENKIFKKL